MFLEPAINGHFPEELEEVLKRDGVIWQTEPEDAQIFKENTIDFLGVNFYHPNRVKDQTLHQTLSELGCQIVIMTNTICQDVA